MIFTAKVAAILAGLTAVLVGLFLFNRYEQVTPVLGEVEIEGNVQDKSIESEMDEILNVLFQIHYISMIDRAPQSPETMIFDELHESMNDLNKLKRVQLETESLSKSPNKIVATTGLVMHTTILSLIDSYESWIAYLRETDETNVSVSEFQYQLADFQSSTHDAYLMLIEGTSLFPFIAVEFAEEGGQNSFNTELRTHFLTKIESMFGELLVEDDELYAKTQTRNTVPVIVRGYQKFLMEE